MKITILNGALSNYDHGMTAALKIITETLTELGVEITEIPLAYSQIPYFDGLSSKSVEGVMKSIRESEGVVIAASVSLFAPSALTQTFLEYFESPENKNVLLNKHCFLLAVSGNGGEGRALEYLTRAVNSLGAYDSARLGLTSTFLSDAAQNENDGSTLEIIERQVEDYYRVVRQNRKLIIPRDYAPTGTAAVFAVKDADFSEKSKHMVKIPVAEVYQKLDLEAFTEQQEQDIQDLTAFLAKKYSEADEEAPIPVELKNPLKAGPAKPRAKTCRQLTQSMPHYYQPQLANGLTAVIQLSISGSEQFEGYLTIDNTECSYTEGQTENPDITILSDVAVWSDVVKGKQTAQKAFMIGRLKVRGNFVLLTRLEQLFKPIA